MVVHSTVTVLFNNKLKYQNNANTKLSIYFTYLAHKKKNNHSHTFLYISAELKKFDYMFKTVK